MPEHNEKPERSSSALTEPPQQFQGKREKRFSKQRKRIEHFGPRTRKQWKDIWQMCVGVHLIFRPDNFIEEIAQRGESPQQVFRGDGGMVQKHPSFCPDIQDQQPAHHQENLRAQGEGFLKGGRWFLGDQDQGNWRNPLYPELRIHQPLQSLIR